jgi:hypothetical protein
MKTLFLALSLLTASTASASVLENCFADSKAEFFTSDLANISKEGNTPVLLLNDAKEVVGVISASVKKGSVGVNKMELCSSLDVSDFYYADDEAADLLKWVKAGTVEITQDEGMIQLNAKVAKKEEYATLLKVDFKAYDVFEEDTEKFKGQPDYVEHWGIPKGKGTFYLYIPKEWLKK